MLMCKIENYFELNTTKLFHCHENIVLLWGTMSWSWESSASCQNIISYSDSWLQDKTHICHQGQEKNLVENYWIIDLYEQLFWRQVSTLSWRLDLLWFHSEMLQIFWREEETCWCIKTLFRRNRIFGCVKIFFL